MRVIKRMWLAATIVALLAVLAAPLRALECDDIVLDDGCLFTVTGGETADPNDGFFVTNADGVPLWDFVKSRDRDALGYPISQRWFDGPFTLQAFQKVILQWDPGKDRMNFYNTLDVLANRFPHVELPFVPAHQVLAEDQGASFGTIIRNHLAILEQNPAIEERFLSEPDWLNLYGLPISYEELEVDGNPQGVQMLRAQRTVFVLWNVPAPGTTVGRVNLQNVPDKVKQLSNVIIPDHAKRPLARLEPGIAAAVLALFRPPPVMTALEQSALRRLETIARNSPDVFWYLYTNYYYSFHEIRTDTRRLDLFVEVSKINWSKLGFGRNEQTALNEVYNTRGDFWWPLFMEAVIQRDWFRDGLIASELGVIRTLRAYLYDLQREIVDAWQVSEAESIRQAQGTILKLFSMPFMDAIDGVEGDALGALFNKYLGKRAYRSGQGVTYLTNLINAIEQIELRGGLTDHQAVLFAYSDLAHISDAGDPGQLDVYLDPNYDGWNSDVGIIVDRRSVDLPRSGSFVVATARETHGSPLSLDQVEHTVRAIENAMGLALPVNQVHVFIKDVNRDIGWFSQISRPNYTLIVPREVADDWFLNTYRRSLAFAVLDLYWNLAPIVKHRWITDGAQAFLAVRAGLLDRGVLEEWRGYCGQKGVADILHTYQWPTQCNYFIGATMLSELHDALGAEEFYRRFHQMFRSFKALQIESIDYRGVWRDDPNRALQIVQDAFLANLDPERAAVVGEVLQRWYY